jgi:hypothetical protein
MRQYTACTIGGATRPIRRSVVGAKDLSSGAALAPDEPERGLAESRRVRLPGPDHQHVSTPLQQARRLRGDRRLREEIESGRFLGRRFAAARTLGEVEADMEWRYFPLASGLRCRASPGAGGAGRAGLRHAGPGWRSRRRSYPLPRRTGSGTATGGATASPMDSRIEVSPADHSHEPHRGARERDA